MVSQEEINSWICPNDRQLTLRAKLGTGWSFHTQRGNRSRPEQLTPEEMDHIMRVVKRNEIIEETEKKRIGTLVDRVENMRNLASGNGTTQCLLCAQEFTILNRSSSRTCDDCKRVVCTKCGVDTVLRHYQQQLWLCKICSEKRELWKRSGAWFFNCLPSYALPKNKGDDGHGTVQDPSPVHENNGKGGVTETTSGSGTMTTTWTRVKHRRHSSSSESEYSLEGADIVPPEEHVPEEPKIPISPGEPLPNDTVPAEVPVAALPTPPSPVVQERSKPIRDRSRSTPIKSGNLTLLAKAQRLHQPPTPTEETKEENQETPMETNAIKVPGLSEFGYLEFSVFYNAVTSQLTVKIYKAADLKPMDPNGLSDPYVKLHLLPGGDHRTKLRTKTIKKTLNPTWDEEFIYHGLTVADMLRKTLRLSVLDEDMVGYDWIGEYRQPLHEIAPNCPLHLIVPLQHERKLLPREAAPPKSNRGRILIALCLNHTDGTITLDILRCAELLAKDANGYSDPYVKVRLLPDPQKEFKRKTAVKLKTLNPSFNEEFIFKVDTRSAIGLTLDLQVWDYDRGAKDDYIGSIQLSLNARGDLLRQWYNLFKYPGKRLEQWHPLAKLKH